MSDSPHRRPEDHLVEPMFAAFHPGEEHGEGNAPDPAPADGSRAPARTSRRGCLGAAPLALLALLPTRARTGRAAGRSPRARRRSRRA